MRAGFDATREIGEALAEGGYGCDPYEGDPPERSRTGLPAGAGEAALARLVEMAGGGGG
jgi:hypothetical protein